MRVGDSTTSPACSSRSPSPIAGVHAHPSRTGAAVSLRPSPGGTLRSGKAGYSTPNRHPYWSAPRRTGQALYSGPKKESGLRSPLARRNLSLPTISWPSSTNVATWQPYNWTAGPTTSKNIINIIRSMTTVDDEGPPVCEACWGNHEDECEAFTDPDGSGCGCVCRKTDSWQGVVPTSNSRVAEEVRSLRPHRDDCDIKLLENISSISSDGKEASKIWSAVSTLGWTTDVVVDRLKTMTAAAANTFTVNGQSGPLYVADTDGTSSGSTQGTGK